MTFISRLVFILVLIGVPVDVADACTIFTASRGGLTLVGNNEDWKDPDTKVWFLAPEKDKYGRVYFGFKNGWAQGGMNDQGLFFDWVAGREHEWKEDPKKKNCEGAVGELILEQAATVDEALLFFSIYNVRAFQRAWIMLADRDGVSAIVGFENGRLKIDLAKGDHQEFGYGQGIAAKRLAGPGALSVDSFVELVKDCRQKGMYSTKYSNVYDLTNGEVHLCTWGARPNVHTFDLEHELEKGNHYYDIPRIEEQLDAPLMVDGKTLVAVEVDPTALTDYPGEYRINATDTFHVTVKEGMLFGRVAAGGQQGILREYRAASESRFFLPYIDQQVTFLRNAEGRVTGLFIESFDGEDRAEKVE